MSEPRAGDFCGRCEGSGELDGASCSECNGIGSARKLAELVSKAVVAGLAKPADLALRQPYTVEGIRAMNAVHPLEPITLLLQELDATRASLDELHCDSAHDLALALEQRNAAIGINATGAEPPAEDPAAADAIAEVMCGWDDVANGTARELVRRIRSLEAHVRRLQRRQAEGGNADST